MKKDLSIPIPIIILIIIVIIVSIMLTKSSKSEKSKLSQIYDKMVENQTYIFTRYDFEEQHKLVTYRKVNKTLIDIYNPEEHLSTLVVEGDTYLISHNNKEYYVYKNNTLDEEVLTDTLKNITNLEYETGKEKIYGKQYKYEEYKGVYDFLIAPSREIDANSASTRFYFKGNQLVYIKTIYDTIDEETEEKVKAEELQTVKVEYNVEDSVFQIPKNYAES